jgi:hypothetical protein
MKLRVIGLSVAGLLALGAVGCSDSPLPPAKGGSNFRITSGGCNQNGSFPIPEGAVQPTSDTHLGPRVEDTEGATVDCEVRSTGSGYVLSGLIRQGNRSFNINGSVDAVGDGSYLGTGAVIHYDATTATLQSGDVDCVLTVNVNQDVAPGRVWGNFNCTEVGNYDQPGVRCTADGSYVLENCRK